MSTKVYDCISRIGDTIEENKDFLTDLDESTWRVAFMRWSRKFRRMTAT